MGLGGVFLGFGALSELLFHQSFPAPEIKPQRCPEILNECETAEGCLGHNTVGFYLDYWGALGLMETAISCEICFMAMCSESSNLFHFNLLLLFDLLRFTFANFHLLLWGTEVHFKPK